MNRDIFSETKMYSFKLCRSSYRRRERRSAFIISERMV